MLNLNNIQERVLSEKGVTRILGVDPDEVYTFFQVYNQNPGDVLYSLTMENAYGECWVKMVSYEELVKILHL